MNLKNLFKRKAIPAPAEAAPEVKAASATTIQEIVPAMYQAWGAYGYLPSLTWYQLANMYVSWTFTAIDKRARTIASLPAKLYRYEKISTGKTIMPYQAKSALAMRNLNFVDEWEVKQALRSVNIKRVEVDEHPFLDLVNCPNREMVRFNFWHLLSVHMDLNGACAIYKAKPYLGNPTELHIIPTTWTGNLKPVPAHDGKRIIAGYKLIDLDIHEDFDPEEIIWIHYNSLRNPFEGMSAIKAHLYSFNLDQYLNQSLSAFYKNGAMFSNVLTTEEFLQQNQYDEIKTQLQNYQGAKNSGQIFLAHGGLKFDKPLQSTAREAMVDEVHKMARDKILSSYDVSAGKVGLVESQNRANLDSVNQNYFQEAIKPGAMLITEYFNHFCVKRYDERLDFEFGYPSFQERELDVEERKANLATGYSTINEERAKEGLEPVAWGDTPILPLGMMPLSSAPEKEPEPEPEPEPETPPAEEGEGEGEKKSFWTDDRLATAWKVFDRRAKALEPLFKKPMIAHFKDYEKRCIDLVERHGVKIKSNIAAMGLQGRRKWLAEHKANLDEMLPPAAEMKKKLKVAMRPAYEETMQTSGNNRVDEFTTAVAVDFEYNVNDPATKGWLGDRLEKFSKTTEKTTRDAVKESLRKDFEAGEGITTIASNLREYFDSAETYRAEFIARTETTSAYNKADVDAVRQMGIADRFVKIWVNEPDARDAHKQAGVDYKDGIDMDDTFKLTDPKTGETDEMDVPGDGEIAGLNINCRCGIVYKPKDIEL